MSSPAILDRARSLLDPSLRSAVANLDPNLLTPITYHLGFTDVDGNAIEAGSGKGIRSALAFLGAEAVGAPAQAALPGAVAVELIHNFSLIHDDIMDGDRMRRHRPTVWDVFGVADAIIVGDALHTLAFEQLLVDPTHSPAMTAGARLAQATSAMIAGQAQDVALDRQPSATLDECLIMEGNKTGALLAQSVAIGGVLGEGSDTAVTALERYGASLGLAFQAVDDVLGIWGDPSVTGKPAGHDIRERKKSMPIAMAMESGAEIASTVRSAYQAESTGDEIEPLADALEQAGIRAAVNDLAKELLDTAISALAVAELAAEPVAELTELANFVAYRQT